MSTPKDEVVESEVEALEMDEADVLDIKKVLDRLDKAEQAGVHCKLYQDEVVIINTFMLSLSQVADANASYAAMLEQQLEAATKKKSRFWKPE